MSLTAFGAVVNHGILKIDKGIKQYYNLKAVDSIEESKEINLSARHDLIKDIIIGEYIRNVLLRT